jgi:hypothetical protein
MGKPITNPALSKQVRDCLRKEFTDFFHEMTRPERNWPSITDQQLVDAIADALMDLGARNKRGIAMTQTLVYELQERVDNFSTRKSG